MTDTRPGTIIVLNGSASGGKTSIAKAIQRTFDEPYLHVGIDLFWLEIFPWEWAGAATNSMQEIPIEGVSPSQIKMGLQPFGRSLITGLHHSVAALAGMGHNVVVDHVLHEADFVTEILMLWQSFPVWLVSVSCPLETVRRRAAVRADRDWPGYVPMATWMFHEAHKHTHGIYDFEVDTSRLTPTECALQIQRDIHERGVPSAFRHLSSLVLSTAGETAFRPLSNTSAPITSDT